jgi:hypothetical protein
MLVICDTVIVLYVKQKEYNYRGLFNICNCSWYKCCDFNSIQTVDHELNCISFLNRELSLLYYDSKGTKFVGLQVVQ